MSEETMRRRDFLRAAALGAAASAPLPLLSGGEAARADAEPMLAAAQDSGDPWRGLKVGVASYTLRKLPLEVCIKDIQRVGLHFVSIKDSHLPMNSTPDQRREVAQRFKEAGITPLSCGNVTMENDEANIRHAFEYARDAGLPTIVCSPHPDSLPILDRMVKEFDIRIAIHNHGPGDKRFPSPYDAWNAVQPYDKRLGLCLDVGHSARLGVNPAEVMLKCRERLYDCHFKDESRLAPNGQPVEVGRGALDKRAMADALLRIRYAHLLSFEYEKDADDPLPGLAESVGYLRGLLEGMKA